ncbi:glucan endo-beta-glucosidase [Acrasis kona]|uniref:Glucan endo-beta-glucosidase n=1 Tax=Acrasis kona TaxID=1008807 RepID=A0AAW2ZLS1_9EUKA
MIRRVKKMKLIYCCVVLGLLFLLSDCRDIRLVNNCPYEIWPVMYNATQLPQDSWKLQPKGEARIPFDKLVATRIWARSGCKFISPCPSDLSIKRACIVCEVGDCPLGHDRYARGEDGTRCGNVGGKPPFDIFEITTGSGGSNDYYDLSRVDGSIGSMRVEVKPYSRPPPVTPPKFSCGRPGCPPHDRKLCPEELQKFSKSGNYLGCSSICSAINDAEMRSKSAILRNIYSGTTRETRNPDGSIRTKGGKPLKDLVCCACGDGHGGCEVDPNSNFCCSPYIKGSHPNWGGRCYHEDWPKPNPDFVRRVNQNPELMKKFREINQDVNYASIFKVGCQDAYSWQFDDFQSTYQCRDADYTIFFCN